jgi:hypothetical protein
MKKSIYRVSLFLTILTVGLCVSASAQDKVDDNTVIRVLQAEFPKLEAEQIDVTFIKHLDRRVKVNLRIRGAQAILYLTWQRSRSGYRWWFEDSAEKSLIVLEKTSQSLMDLKEEGVEAPGARDDAVGQRDEPTGEKSKKPAEKTAERLDVIEVRKEAPPVEEKKPEARPEEKSGPVKADEKKPEPAVEPVKKEEVKSEPAEAKEQPPAQPAEEKSDAKPAETPAKAEPERKETPAETVPEKSEPEPGEKPVEPARSEPEAKSEEPLEKPAGEEAVPTPEQPVENAAESAFVPPELATSIDGTPREFLTSLILTIGRGFDDKYAMFLLRPTEMQGEVKERDYNSGVERWKDQFAAVHEELKKAEKVAITKIVLQRPQTVEIERATLTALNNRIRNVDAVYTYVKINLIIDGSPAYLAIGGILHTDNGWRLGGRVELVRQISIQ